MNRPGKSDPALQHSAVQPENLIQYYPVFLKGLKIGYLYANSDKAWNSLMLVLDAMDVDSRMEAVLTWGDRVKAGKAQGLSPLEILEHWKGAPEHPLAGAVPKDAELLSRNLLVPVVLQVHER